MVSEINPILTSNIDLSKTNLIKTVGLGWLSLMVATNAVNQ